MTAVPRKRKTKRRTSPHYAYEAMKAALPPLSPAEYEAAIRRIAKGLGL